MIKIAAKRSSSGIAPRTGGEQIESTASLRPAPLEQTDRTALFEYEKTHLSHRQARPLYEQDRAVIASLWLDQGSTPLSVRANRNHSVAAWHAEILLCLDVIENAEYYRGKSIFWAVGLKPCRMCAAWISTLMRELKCNYQVVYARHDPGPLAQGTELDRLLGIQESLNSWGSRNPERARSVFGDVQSPSQTNE